MNWNIVSKARHLTEETSPPPGGHPLKRCSYYGPKKAGRVYKNGKKIFVLNLCVTSNLPDYLYSKLSGSSDFSHSMQSVLPLPQTPDAHAIQELKLTIGSC